MIAIRDRARRVRSALKRLSGLVDVPRSNIAAIALASAGAGFAEAGVLALIAYTAAQMSTMTDRGPFAFGPIELNGSTSILLAIATVLAAIRLLLQLTLARLPARLSGRVQSRLRAELMDAYLSASWAERSKEKEGHLQELMGRQSAAAGIAVLMLAAGLAAALEFMTLLAAALALSVVVSLAVIVIAAALFLALRPMSRGVRRRSAETSAASMDQASGVAEAVRLAEELEVFGVEEAERLRILALTESLERHYVGMRTLSRVVPVTYQSAVIFLLIGGISVLYALGTARFAALSAVVLLLVRASAYGQNLQTAYQGVGEALPYLDRVMAAIERYVGSARRRGTRPIESIQTVVFNDVSFAYRAGSPVLRNVSFSIGSGEAIGVVGPSGAGKSTMLQLLLGLRQPSGGAYSVNDLPASEIDAEAWHRRVSFLPQEPNLLRGTVAENIRFYRDWVDDHGIERAARLAHIHDDIMSWRDGYGTVIGQRADAVSGGQRQRLCLARALAGMPELLVLDEPTSSLDPRSERLIQESLENLRGKVMLVVVAHRLTTLGLCDRVMVIRHGRLEAFAQAAALYGSNDFYRQSVDLASAGKPL